MIICALAHGIILVWHDLKPVWVMNGQVLENFLSTHLLLVNFLLNDDFPNNHILNFDVTITYHLEMYFDGESSS